MKWCQKHWDMLREAIRSRGLWKFVADSGEEAFTNEVLALEGHGAPFDPLMGAHWQLTGEVMDNLPPEERLACFAGEWCPMCAVQESYEWWDDPQQNTTAAKRPDHAADAQGWIDRKADAALRYAKEQGMPL